MGDQPNPIAQRRWFPSSRYAYSNDERHRGTTISETEGDPLALARLEESDQSRRLGTTPAERAGRIGSYRPGYGRSAAQNRDTGATDPFATGFFNTGAGRTTAADGEPLMTAKAPQFSWDAAYPHVAGTALPNLMPPAPTMVRYRSPASLVIPATSSATDTQRDASITSNAAQNASLYDPNNNPFKTEVRPPQAAALDLTKQNPNGWQQAGRTDLERIAGRYRGTPTGLPAAYAYAPKAADGQAFTPDYPYKTVSANPAIQPQTSYQKVVASRYRTPTAANAEN